MAKRHATGTRLQQVEQLEDRMVLSADPLAGLLGGGVNHHAFDEVPIFQQEVPVAVGHHDLPAEVPIFSHDDVFDFASDHHLFHDPDFHLTDVQHSEATQTVDGLIDNIEQTLASAHNSSGLTQVRNQYGLRGGGQTVAVIDSGIAYDHAALGGGLGANYRVVGGYDFAEGDTDPFDDGPEGSHGTHVAGIIGADGGTLATEGVAPDVDLLALRVFNDAGDGYFSWVERSLQWIYNNRNSFANPVTAVNISLGVSWNSDSPPSWAMLEDEFQDLYNAGIFVAVSAGNDFTAYNEPGLSYPASSPWVVPVMSADDNGNLSYFSQRHSSAIAAPGRWVTSTVPDYDGNNNGTTDDWGTKSGTSMASPYVAGASVIIREAMQFVGMTNITQDTIYQHMRDTADTLYDSATSANYLRLNLDAAISALMPSDDFGSTVGTAHSLGTLSDTVSLSGVVGELDDVDYFTFTAGASGTVSFTASNATHYLDVAWTGDGGAASGESVSLDVVAGQTYTVGLTTEDGIGYYDLDVTVDSTITPIDWGTVAAVTHSQVALAGETIFQITAANAGIFTAQASFAGGHSMWMEFTNGVDTIVGSNSSGSSVRIDHSFAAGDTFFLRITGDASAADFRLTNLVSAEGSTLSVSGTSGDDSVTFTAGSTLYLSVFDTDYSFSGGSFSKFHFDGQGGSDTLSFAGTAADETFTLSPTSLHVDGGAYTATASGFETLLVNAGDGSDHVSFRDSAGDDLYRAWSTQAILSGDGFYLFASDFEASHASSSGGNDEARLYDTAGDDLFRTWFNRSVLSGDGFYNYVEQFDQVTAIASSGYDVARMYDSAGDDVFRGYHDSATMSYDTSVNEAQDFDRVFAYSTSGHDVAHFYDSTGNDLFRAWHNRAVLSGDGFYNYAERFSETYAYASSGVDVAHFYDSVGDDLFRAWHNRAVMAGDGFYNYAQWFDQTFAYASSGNDVAKFYDSSGDDLYRAWHNRAVLSGNGFYNYAERFGETYAYGGSGNDVARFYDSVGDDLFRTWHNRAVMSGDGFYNYAQMFGHVSGYASHGNDHAHFYDSVHDDLFRAWGSHAVMSGSGFYNFAASFDSFTGTASQGNDQARLFDTTGDDHLTAGNWGAAIASDHCYSMAENFGAVTATSSSGGNDSSDVDAVDYLFSMIGNW